MISLSTSAIDLIRAKYLPQPKLQEAQVQDKKENEIPTEGIDKYGNPITYNAKQREALSLAVSGQNLVVIGSAGAGKSTVQRSVCSALLQTGRIPSLQESHKHLKIGTPGIVIIAFTKLAVNNIKNIVSADMKQNCLTHHKLLEYEPEFYEAMNSEGEVVTKMQFLPTRNRYRPLDPNIKVVIIEEGSLYSPQLYAELMEAMPHKPQVLMLGDINQLKPVFGDPDLGYKIVQWPTVELTEIYRQALDSPILSLAHDILKGIPISSAELKAKEKEGLKITVLKKKVSAHNALTQFGEKYFPAAIESGLYNPEEDMILIPFNKGFGTTDLNKFLASTLAARDKKEVFEIIAGFQKIYLSVGDKILFDREAGVVTAIKKNHSYVGKPPSPSSTALNYFGHYTDSNIHVSEEDEDTIEAMLAAAVSSDEKTRQASHTVSLYLENLDKEVHLSAVGDVSNILLSYSLTVHKAQGSEWKKVFLILHNSHATMLSRELLYTAVTRASKELIILCEEDTFEKGIKQQQIKGNNLEEKRAYFQNKLYGTSIAASTIDEQRKEDETIRSVV